MRKKKQHQWTYSTTRRTRICDVVGCGEVQTARHWLEPWDEAFGDWVLEGSFYEH